MVFARSAAMGFNRYADRNIDARNPRTVVREIPSGIIKPSAALLFIIFSCILFIGICFTINPLCFYLSPVALLVVLGYSYTKRFTALCHLFLGLGLALAPIGAYLTLTGQFALLPLFFSFLVLCWVSGFDIIYALQDEQFDRENDLNSIPAWLGAKKALVLSTVLHFLSAFFMIVAGVWAGGGLFYWIGACLFCMFLVYQHLLVKPDDLSRINRAFFTSNGIASVVFGIFVALDILWR